MPEVAVPESRASDGLRGEGPVIGQPRVGALRGEREHILSECRWASTLAGCLRAVRFGARGSCRIRNAKLCGRVIPFDLMHGDHIVPWSRGGTTTLTISRRCAVLQPAEGKPTSGGRTRLLPA